MPTKGESSKASSLSTSAKAFMSESQGTLKGFTPWEPAEVAETAVASHPATTQMHFFLPSRSNGPFKMGVLLELENKKTLS